MQSSKMNLIICLPLVLALVAPLFCLPVGQATTATAAAATATALEKQPVCDESIVKAVAKQCRNANKLQDLAEFYAFYERFEHLTNKCLRHETALKEASKTSQLAEDECKRQNLFFYQVGQLAELISRWRSPSGHVCNTQFSMRLYHLHQQVEPTRERQPVLGRMLRQLANSVALRCRLSLNRRLRSVESRAPDTQQHTRFIVGLVNLGSGEQFVARLRPLERLDQFVPTLERELSARAPDGATSSFGRAGYELKSASSVRLSYDAVKMSCRALKTYHVNLMGSLGLLASLGYGSPPQALKRLKFEESRADGALAQRWLLSALLCQSMRNVLKMQTNTLENKLQYRFKVTATQEADLSLDDEQDDTFATFGLPETLPASQLAELAQPDLVEALASYGAVSASSERAALHKAHLLTGPSYRLARSIGAYLDVGQRANRLEAIEEAIGMELQFDEISAHGDEEDDDEE